MLMKQKSDHTLRNREIKTINKCNFSLIATKSQQWAGFPGGPSGKRSACQCRRYRFDPWVRKIPWRRKQQPTPLFLPGEPHGQRTLVGYSPYVCARAKSLQQCLTLCNPIDYNNQDHLGSPRIQSMGQQKSQIQLTY